MTPVRLKLKNFTGIRSGLNRDELEIDFESILTGNQLVAIVGENGSGKTTLIDSLHPFRLMPSRANGYSPGSFSFYDNTYGEALKEFEFTHEGERYLSSLVIKGQNKTKTTQGYLHKRVNDVWVPVELPDGMVSDGKSVTYDKCVEHVVGSPEMYFTSVFSSQNKRSLSSYGNSEIKGLMTELLSLDDIKELGKQANDVTKLLRFNLKGMQSELGEIHAKEADIKNLEQSLVSTNSSIGMAEESRRLSRIELQEVTKKLAEVQANDNANLEIEQKRQELQSTINGLSQKRSSTGSEFDADIKTANDRVLSIEQAHWKDADYHGKQLSSINTQIDKQNALLLRSDDVELAKRKIVVFEQETLRLNKSLVDSDIKLEELSALTHKGIGLKEQLNSLANNGRQCAAKLADVKTRSELIKTVPCSGMDINSQCPLLDNANDAAKQIPAFTNEDIENRSKYTVISTELDGIKKQIVALGDAEQKHQSIEGEIAILRTQVINNNQVIALEESINNAKSTIKSLNVQVSDLDDRQKEQGISFDNSMIKAVQQITTIKGRKDNELGLIDKSLQQSQDKLSVLPPASDTAAVDLANSELSRSDEELSKSENILESFRADAARYNAQINALKEVLNGSDDKKELAEKIETEISYWMQLTTAFGNNGIIALSIDDAGPSLSSLANDLLMSAYGPRFSVSIKTQVEKNDGDMKETFDVIVFDADSDDEKSVSIMSGGEKIYINEALIRAIALYNTEMSGRKYGCLFADESDGALDPEKKVQFVQMKRKMLEIGGYDNEIFISHTPELWEMADVKIDMDEFRIN